MLILFTTIEELVVGVVHGHALVETLAGISGRSWLDLLAPGLLMLVVLIPMISFEELDIAMGKGSLLRLLRNPAPHE